MANDDNQHVRAIKPVDGERIEQGEAFDDWFVQNLVDNQMRVTVYLRKADGNNVKHTKRDYMVGNLQYIEFAKGDKDADN